MTIFFDRRPLADIQNALTFFKGREFKSPERSTVPLLSLLTHGAEMWQQILAELELPESEIAVHLEYTVRPPQGNGNASHTDVMLIAGRRACAVEAKWTEPPYPTVGKWLGAEPYSLNKLAVLNGWLSLLQPHGNRNLQLHDFLDVTYQTVHRAASACAAGDSAGLAYLVFTPRADGYPAEMGHLRGSLERLAVALGAPDNFPLRLLEVELRPTPAFARIAALPKGQPQTGVEVQNALHGPPLFEFTGFKVHRLPETAAT